METQTPTNALFWPYLRPILEAQTGVVYVMLSDANGMDRMLEDSVSEDVYPGIFVMRPKYQGRNQADALLMALFDTVFFVFCQGKANDREAQDAAYDQAEAIAASVLQHLQTDRRSYRNQLEFDSIRMEPVLYQSSVDAAFGYEVRFKMGLPAGEIFG